MLRTLVIASAATAALSSLAPAAIVITEVMSSSAHSGGTNNGDWFEITNTGPTAVDITGWSWDDDSATPGVSNFGSLTSIPAGASVIVSEETVGAEASFKSAWGIPSTTVVNLGSTVFVGLGSGGDQVNIFDSSNTLVTGVSFGTATSGYSFEWDTSGNPLGLSVIGENGAFQAVSNGQNTGLGPGVDVGSPGTAIPEPASLAALGLLTIAGLRRRR